MRDASQTPVIIGVGEYTDRPEAVAQALEPLALMARALQAAEADAGCKLLSRLESLELIGLISWRYEDPVSLLCQRLDITPARQVNASMGGETPIRLVHEAALRIARGELKFAAIVGGEAMHAAAKAAKGQFALSAAVGGAGDDTGGLPWTPPAPRDKAFKFASSSFEMSPVAQQLEMLDPARVYPLYEMAAQARWQQSPMQGQAESAGLWAQFAQVAAENPYAWIREAPAAEAIATPGPKNRMINWPYPKLMTANPMVNQGAAVIVTSLAEAQAMGVDPDRIVHIWGGAAAREPEDWLKRDRYDRSTAQEQVLAKALEIAGGRSSIDHMELYSCFPVVPKMALRAMGETPGRSLPSVTGGLTFFGGPLNNYMSHALCAMVRKLREEPESRGLLYGQGGYVNKHHAMILSRLPPPADLVQDYSVQAQAEAAREPVPEVLNDYQGPARIETYTVAFGRDGTPLNGIVVLRTPAGARTLARVDAEDSASMDLLQSTQDNAIGQPGHVRIDSFGLPLWESGEQPRDRRAIPRKFCRVEREGPLTIVTIDRPEAMNALHPRANAELAEIFDDFAADPDQWVAILTGAGDRAFSAGNDLKFMGAALMRGESIHPPLSGFAGLTARFDLNKPVIAAVNGVAMGGGFEIALACDLIIASEQAVFALPEPKVGIAALAGGLLRLEAHVGPKRARDMVLTARRVSAEEGLSLGFVNEVTPAEDLMPTARRWAARILECSPMSIRASKEVMQRGADEASLEAAYRKQMAYPAVKALLSSADFHEGPAAFAQKRKPAWKGR